MKLNSRNALRLIEEFEAAIIAHEWSGSGDPDLRDGLEADYKRRKEKLQKFVIDCIIGDSDTLNVKLKS